MDGETEDLKAILRKHREAIGWTMTDIKRLSPTIAQHRIHLNEDATPKTDPQHRLNPMMQEAVHAEIVKLLDNGIIYPILIANASVLSTRFQRNPVSP